ncbi:MAG TPA: ATP-binding cassette domain-containing protein, partial [Burkholderiaceae bacterium]|nr:ATP-binding cassette domain-containing protein [Burkholderiaceae bacterium]
MPAPAASPGAVPLLSISRLTVDFATASGSARVVDGVDFGIARGEKCALVGESGSGKTVTALSVLRLNADARYQGAIRFDGRDLLGCSEREMRGVRGREIAMIFQEPMTALNPLYPIGDQICEAIELHEGLSRAQARRHAIELLARTQVPEPER